MSRPRRPTRSQILRRRLAALTLLAVLGIAAVYLALTATLFAPADSQGARLVEMSIQSKAVGERVGVNVVVPRRQSEPRGERPLLIFLHGRGGTEDSFTGNEVVYEGLAKLGPKAPIVAFPDGGESSYWHDRDSGDWGRYLMREAIPAVARRFGADPGRVAVGGISMGGFGAYDLALDHPRRFCAVGGHSAALWFEGGETAPGAFDDRADFERNDVVERAGDPGAFGAMRIWNDYGTADPFRPYNEGFVAALRANGAELSAHVWPGGHDGAYWDRHWPAYLRFYANSLASCK